jgi:holo-[acyl-carrier protein] synthase
MIAVLGLGVDIVDVRVMAGIIAGKAGKSFIKKTFTKKEIAYSKGIDQKISAIFASKEAAFKAFKTGWLDGKLVEVVHMRNGAPSLLLHGKMGKLAKKMKIKKMLISLSYTECYAIATVILSQ